MELALVIIFALMIVWAAYLVGKAIYDYNNKPIQAYYWHSTTGHVHGPFLKAVEVRDFMLLEEANKRGGHYEVTRINRRELRSDRLRRQLSNDG